MVQYNLLTHLSDSLHAPNHGSLSYVIDENN